MASDFEIFISYAHLDDQPLVEGESGWIADFHRVLSIRLAQLLGREVRIWRDPELRGNERFAHSLVDQVRSVDFLVSVLSPRYIRSEWCRREVETFVEEHAGAAKGKGPGVFKVVKTAIPLEKQPEVLQTMLGYEFYKVDPQTRRPRELGQRPGSGAEQEYWDRLEDLAQDLCEQLEALEEQAAAPPAVADGRTVYLAETTSDLASERDRIRRELREQGHRVLPDRPLPLNVPALEEAVRSSLAEADLAVHPIGGFYGIVPEGGAASVVEIQNRLAAADSGERGTRRIIWIAPGLTPAEDRQNELIRRLEEDAEAQLGADVLRSRLEDLKTLIADRLAVGEEPAPEHAAGAEAAEPRVYLLCDPRDVDAVDPLADHLFDAAGFEVTLPVFEGEPSALQQDYIENLKLCDAVLIFWGHANELWLRAKLRDLTKAMGYGRTAPFRAAAVYLGPPAVPAKKRLRTREAQVIKAGETFDPGLVADFVAAVRTGRAS